MGAGGRVGLVGGWVTGGWDWLGGGWQGGWGWLGAGGRVGPVGGWVARGRWLGAGCQGEVGCIHRLDEVRGSLCLVGWSGWRVRCSPAGLCVVARASEVAGRWRRRGGAHGRAKDCVACLCSSGSSEGSSALPRGAVSLGTSEVNLNRPLDTTAAGRLVPPGAQSSPQRHKACPALPSPLAHPQRAPPSMRWLLRLRPPPPPSTND